MKMKDLARLVICMLLMLALIWGLVPRSTAMAATLSVTNTNDSGSGSLRQAILDAAPGDMITLGITGAITLTSGELVITKNLSLNGPGPAFLSIGAGGASRVLDNSASLTVSGLTIRDGNDAAGSGGAIFNTGTLTLINSAVLNSVASLGGGIFNSGGTVHIMASTISGNRGDMGDGGGIYNAAPGQLTITASAVINNSAQNDGGGMLSGGIATIANSTFSGNQSVSGGAILNGGTLKLNNVTIAGNTGNRLTGGLRSIAGTVNVQNSILAGNTSTLPDCAGVISSGGFNLLGNASGCSFTFTTGDQMGSSASLLNPLLGPLQDNGGPTLTQALLAGSPAIDAGSPATPDSGGMACEVTDQRGAPRPLDGDSNGSARCDSGAVEQAPGSGAWANNSSPTLQGLATTFTGFAPGSGVTYQWAFGDGATSSGPSADASHTYAAAGTYNATLTAINSLGSTLVATAVTVMAANHVYFPLLLR